MKSKLIFCITCLLVCTNVFAQKSYKRNPNFHTFLGVDVDNTSIKTNGLYINGVYKGFGAEKAGVRRGDTLMAINSTALSNFDELVKTLDRNKPGDNIELSIVRDNQLQKIIAMVSDYPEFLKYNSMLWMREWNKGRDEIKRANLGVNVDPVWERYAVKVAKVSENSAAANAGIKPGDTILKMDNYEFATIEELKYYLSKYNPGDLVTLTVLREGKLESVKVTLGEEVIHLNKKDKDKEKS